MRTMRYTFAILLLLLMLSGCASKENYLSREEAHKNGYIVLHGTNSVNSDRFEIFVQNVDARRQDSISIVVYDLTDNQYVTDISYDGEKLIASRYFMDRESNQSQVSSDMIFTHISKTSSKNYFLVDEQNIQPDLWIYQGK